MTEKHVGEDEITLIASILTSAFVGLYVTGLAVRKYMVKGGGYPDEDEVLARITREEERALELDFTALNSAYPSRLARPGAPNDNPRADRGPALIANPKGKDEEDYIISSEEMGPPPSESDSYYSYS